MRLGTRNPYSIADRPGKTSNGFRSLQAANLVNWNGEIQSPAKSVFRLDEKLAL
jgi:hypothetical protein